jgi:pyruvate dehydrogenase E2 component (dihydrolipoamide acetyltransferase)
MAEIRDVKVPDIGDFEAVDIVEVLVSPGDRVEVEDSLITLESDKATMDVPSPLAGTVRELKVKTGDQVAEGDVILTLELSEEKAEEEDKEGEQREKEETEETSEPEEAKKATEERKAEEKEPEEEEPPEKPERAGPPPPRAFDEEIEEQAFLEAHASPSVRRFARELGADLGKIEGSGRKGRITREDVEAYVKRRLQGPELPGGAFALPEMPEVDFSRFGEIERVERSRIRKIGARNLHRSWLHVPHVTQHDEADVTDLEAFRREHDAEARERGFKLTPIAFLMKACVAALQKYPDFNASLDPDGEHLIRKRYYHLGIAVDTPDGLVVPVIRDVDRKGLFQCAEEVVEVAGRARERKLKKEDLEGASFSISSLGGIGGTAFTPIVNVPEVAILGVSKMEWKPVWRDGELVRRRILPLSLSYDHRVIDGADAARFLRWVCTCLEQPMTLVL